MKFTILFFSIAFSLQSYAKCTGEKLEDFAPKKFMVYQVDRDHKFVGKKTPLVYQKEQEELSDSDRLYHISHNKSPNKHCSLHTNPNQTFSLKTKEHLSVKTIENNNGVYRLVLEHPTLAHIDCKGIKTMGDLRDTLDPYLTFECKDRFKPKTDNGRLPASVE